jgi:hypothetical protein
MSVLSKGLLILSLLFITSAANASFLISPTNGQSAAQQEKDKYYCNDWAIQKTGYYPEDYSTAKASDKITSVKGEIKTHEEVISRFNKIKHGCLKVTGYIVKQY